MTTPDKITPELVAGALKGFFWTTWYVCFTIMLIAVTVALVKWTVS